MKNAPYLLLYFFLFLGLTTIVAQEPEKIIIEYSDFFDVNQIEIPDAALLTGNVRIIHDGVRMFCNKAYYFQKENYVKAFGDVRMIQGDTLFMNSKYAEYSGNVKQAYATGNVVMRSPEMTLATDTLNFDRNTQQASYNSYGTITNKDNVLKSKAGIYYANEKKFQFLSAVTITNPKYVVKSNHLDYYNTSGLSYLSGPSTITSKENFIYTEKGFYDSKKNVGHFTRKSYIKYKDRLIRGDSLYYDRGREFASATNNVKITDTVNKGIIKGHYAEVYKKKDSMFVTRRAVAINMMDKDSIYIHGKKLLITGKPEQRIVRAFDDARIYKTDMSGKCDSIHSSQISNITQLIGKPILWNFENQMTGDVMHLVGNDNTQKLDSLKVLNNAFIISKDSLGTGFNQVKGQNLYGKFRGNKLYEADIIKNTEVIYYMRNDAKELIGINKNVSSRINMTLDGNQIDSMTFFTNVDGDIYPEKDLPENARKLRGFVWREEERIRSKDDLFSKEDNDLDAQIQIEKKIRMERDSIEIHNENKNIEEMLAEQKEIKKDLVNQQKTAVQSKLVYYEIFEKYNNQIIIDENGTQLLVKDNKFMFPANARSFENYKKNNPKFKKEIPIDMVLWDTKKMQFGVYDGGYFDEGKVEDVDLINKNTTLDDLFELYNNRIIVDKNGLKLLIKDNKFQFVSNPKAFDRYKKNNPKFKKELRINKVLWDWKTMQFGKYDGGYLNDGKVEEVDVVDKELPLDELFVLYDNRIILDKNGQKLLIKDNKFQFPANPKSFDNYKKNNPEHKKELRIHRILWDTKTMQFGKYDGGYFPEGKAEEVEILNKDVTFDELFLSYKNRIILDKNGLKLLIRESKFQFFPNPESCENYKKNNPEYKKELRINAVLWDWKTMQFGKYDGGYYSEGK